MAMNELTVASQMSQGETTVETERPPSFDDPSLVCHRHPWSRIDEHSIPPVSRTVRLFWLDPSEWNHRRTLREYVLGPVIFSVLPYFLISTSRSLMCDLGQLPVLLLTVYTISHLHMLAHKKRKLVHVKRSYIQYIPCRFS
jgi:hypothetical protein